MRDIILTSLGIAVIIDLTLLFVLFRHRADTLHTAFIHLISGALFWNLNIFCFILRGNALYASLVYLASLYFFTARFIFISQYTHSQNERESWALIAMSCMLAILAFIPNALFSDAFTTSDGYVLVKNGWFTLPFALFMLYMTIRPLQILIRHYLHNRTYEVKILTFGMSFYSILTISTNLILPVFFDTAIFNTIGPAFSTVFTLIVFYAMNRYQFLHVKLIIQRGIIFAVLYGLVLALYSAVASTLVYLTHSSFQSNEFITALMILTAALFVSPMERKLRRITDRFLLQQNYLYGNVTRELADLFAQHVTARALLQHTLAYVKTTLRLRSIKYCRDALLPDTIPPEYTTFPVHASTGCTGHLLVGQKLSYDPLTHTDRDILEFYTTILGVALEKARLFEHLGDEVAAQTKEIARIHKESRANLAMLAHDLKTPLTVLLGTHELISASPEISRERFDSLALPLRNITRTVNEIVSFETHATQPHTTLNLSHLMSELAEQMSVLCAMDHIAFTDTIAPNIMLHGDPRSLELMINNVLSNAIRYRRTTLPTISLSLIPHGHETHLTITDNGIGIPKSDMHHLFTSGFRAQNALDRDGSGTGLATTQKIANDHNIAIQIESTEHVGTTVTIIFQTPVVHLPQDVHAQFLHRDL